MKLDKQFLNKFSKITGYSIEKSKEILEAEIKILDIELYRALQSFIELIA